MIKAWVGLHGSGKTYLMTDTLLDRRARNWRICTNFGFYGSELIVTAEDIMALVVAQAKLPKDERPPTVVAIDEVGMLWDCRESRQFPEAMKMLLAECRKLRVDLFFTAQDLDDVDVKVRRQVHEVVECTGLFPKTYGVDPFTKDPLTHPRLILQRHFKGRGYGTSKQQGMGAQLTRFRWEVANSYDTDRLIVTLAEVLEAEWKRAEDRPTLRMVAPSGVDLSAAPA